MSSPLSELLKEYRLKANLSQKQLADILNVSQVTVSRIESGVLIPSDEIFSRLKSLFETRFKSEPSTRSSYIRLNEKKETKNYFNKRIQISYFKSTYGKRSGDALSMNCVGENLFLCLADAVGHGDEASYMSSAIEFGFQQSLDLMSKYATVRAIMQSLNSAMEKTKAMWVGTPSLLIGSLNVETHVLEILSKGFPLPIIFNTQKDKVDMKKWGSDIALDESYDFYKERLEKGDSVLFFTDGFLDSTGISRNKLSSSFVSSASAFKGDSEAILSNILEEFKIENQIDDITLMVLSVSRW